METDYVRIKRQSLETFCQQVFQSLNLSEDDARMAATVLVAADARGIPSHGVARLQRYVNGLKRGLMLPDAPVKALVDTPSSIVLHAHGAMGAPVSVKAMESVINKAKTNGVALGCVRDSNHFGIAGYYAMMALDEDMLGIAMTNTAALGVSTFGRRVMYGTNPLAFAAPAEGAERVYFAGHKEFEKEEECLRMGIPLLEETYDQICMIGNEHDVDSPPVLKKDTFQF